ncbi:MAG TPA: amidohydrolase family protein [Xanthobacteraceae bacterium]|nr:amidohydrolase family protein [Xanthobacteraceae bacterium]
MALDFILRHARVGADQAEIVDIGVAGGRIAEIASRIDAEAASGDVAGKLVVAGFVETHIHLDKSRILDRCNSRDGTLAEAIAAVAAAKRAFTEDDIYERARHTLERAILQGTMRMRTHVEVDPRVGLRGFRAIQRLKRDYAWAIDLEICVFPQEGLLNDPGTEELLIEACELGADLIGGCPYTDSDPQGHIARIFAIAQKFDCDIDVHLDFDLDPSWMSLDEVCRQAKELRWGGRVAIGHVTKLSALEPARFAAVANRLADAGVAVTVLPSTDLFLMGRDREHNIPRGVAPAHRLLASGVVCSIASNNILNPFTPFGDCSLLRMANLYANIAQIGRPPELSSCLDMVTTLPAKLMNLRDYGIVVGNPAGFVVLDCTDRTAAVAEIARPLFGMKNGRRTFVWPPPKLLYQAGNGLR